MTKLIRKFVDYLSQLHRAALGTHQCYLLNGLVVAVATDVY
jgi:hypothetical protein